MATTVASGSRIRLRELALDDWSDVHAYASRPEACRFQAWGPNTPDYWGQGLGTEVARQLLDKGFRDLKLDRIYATCDPRNVASARILQKVGMTCEGRQRHTMLIRDGWRDSEMYTILEDEYFR